MPTLSIQSGSYSFKASLNSNPTTQKLLDALPLTGSANTWGDEIYFSIPISAELEPGATDQLPAGSLAYWPPGNAFCIIWGPTPASHDDEPRFASPVNALGQIEGDLSALQQIRDGDTITLQLAD